MKKLISLLLAICLVLSISTVLFSCDNNKDDDDEPKKGKKTTEAATTLPANEALKPGLLIPTAMTFKEPNGSSETIALTWDKNSCKFEIEGHKYSFEYDQIKKTLSFKNEGGGEITDINDFLKFDEKGRVTNVSWTYDDDQEDIMSFAYENGKMSVISCIDSDATFPVVLNPDFETNTVLAPPFDDPDTFIIFSEHGDIMSAKEGTEQTDFYTYEYDEKGNTKSISIYGATFELSYGDAEMTEAWQKYVTKFVLMYTLKMPLTLFATDIMCSNLPR